MVANYELTFCGNLESQKDLLGKKFWAFAGCVGGLVLVDKLSTCSIKASNKTLLTFKCTDHKRLEFSTI